LWRGKFVDREYGLAGAKEFWLLQYSEGDRVLLIHRELQREGPFWNVWDKIHLEGALKWLPPHGGEIISDQKRREIIENVKTALDWMDLPYEIIS
jgi:hypothetical protein